MKATSNWLFFIFLSLGIFLSSQATGGDLNPEKVYRIVYTQKSNEWYMEQAKLWKIEVDKNPKNAQAWMNYYFANRYANWPEGYREFSEDKKTRLSQIITDMGEAVPNSYEYNYLKFFNSDEKKDNLPYLEKAYQLQPQKADTYYEFIVYDLLNGEDAKAKEFLEKLYESEDIATGLVNYNYNVMMSTEENAILFTNGDNDTYPCWMLQDVKGVRPDVTIMNISMIRKRPYLEKLLKKENLKVDLDNLPDPKNSNFTAELCKTFNRKYPEIPIYFALTVYEGFTESIADNLYLVGLAYKYSPDRIDNIAMLKNNWENNLRLDYLNYDWYSSHYVATETIEKMLNQNYIAPALSLFKHYKIAGESDKAEEMKQFALRIAKPAGKEDEVMKILMKQ